MNKAKPALVLLAKLLVSAGLLAFFFTRIHIGRFFDTFASADFFYIAITLLIYMATQLISTVRWMVLARPLGFATPFAVLFRYYLIGMFFNLFAPGTIGGDVSRIYYLSRDGEQQTEERFSSAMMRAALSVFMDRAVGMMVLVWLGALGLLLWPQYAVPTPVRTLTFALALGLLAGALLLPLLDRIVSANGHPIIVKLRLALRTYRAHWRAVAIAVALSFAVHLIQAWLHVIMGRALHIEIPLSYCVILYPLVGTFSALPVSLNGLGLREGGYLFMLQIIGFSSETGIAFGLLLFLTVAADSLVGGVLFLFKRSGTPVVIASKDPAHMR
jgi:uncharacterized membrane protein YbhN (UPF0104 family)